MAKINGGPRDDTLTGTSGDDIISGKGGHDTLYGGDGNDVLNGGKGADWLYGGNGDDTMVNGWGAEYMTGGAGADTFSFDTAFGDYNNDHILDLNFAEGDTIVINGMSFSSDAELAALSGVDGFLVENRDGDVLVFHQATDFILLIDDYVI